MHRRLQRVSLLVAALSLAAAAAIAALDGYHFNIFGLHVRGNRIDRALWLALVMLIVHVWAGGRLWLTGGRLARAARACAALAQPHGMAIVLASAVFIGAWALGARAVGGADSYGYVSQAHLWVSGRLVQPQPWSDDVPWRFGPESFQPLGYRVALDGTSLAPVYSPGLPLLMAAAILLGGACAAFLVVPVAAATLVYGTYRLGRALRSEWVGVAAAWLVATSPTFAFVAVQPMSDVPVAAAWVLAFALAVRGSASTALASGLVAGLAALIRINHGPFVVALLAWYASVGWVRRGVPVSSRWRPLVWFGLGLLPGAVGAGLFNWTLNGSPFQSGYGSNHELFRLEYVVPNLRQYTTWVTLTQTPLVWLGVGALLVPSRRLWPDPAMRRMVACIALFGLLLWTQYCFYYVFNDWWYLRFLLAAAPFVFIGLAAAGAAIGSVVPRWVTVPVICLALAAPVLLGSIRRLYNFDARQGEAHYATSARMVSSVADRASVIYSMQHSGSVRYYAGRMTLRYDYLDPGELERSVQWFVDRGIHPYAALEWWEIEAWRQRFGDGSALARLDLPPIRQSAKLKGMVVYDLLAPGRAEPRVVAMTAADLACRPPAPRVEFSLMGEAE